MKLRDSTVFARVTDDGEPVTVKGKVEVRYGPKSAKAYHAAASNLSVIDGAPVLPDDHCVPAEESSTGKEKSAAAKAKAASAVPTAPTGSVIAYADGASSGNPGPSGLGVVVLDGDRRVERSEYLGNGTNNIAELTAIQRAIEAVPETEKVLVIHTDSQYSIGVLSKGWKAKANTELVLAVRALIAKRGNVKFVYVPGHSGIVLNERADELARLAVETKKTLEKVSEEGKRSFAKSS